jgi:hypothetical protein
VKTGFGTLRFGASVSVSMGVSVAISFLLLS